MNTTAKEIMTTEMLHATETMTIEEALKILVNSRITGLPVVDKSGSMVGVLSEYDILKQIAKSDKITTDLFQQPISFSRNTEVLTEDTPLEVIMDRFIQSKFRRLPVINSDGKLVGIITRRDLMRVFYYRSRLT